MMIAIPPPEDLQAIPRRVLYDSRRRALQWLTALLGVACFGGIACCGSLAYEEALLWSTGGVLLLWSSTILYRRRQLMRTGEAIGHLANHKPLFVFNWVRFVRDGRHVRGLALKRSPSSIILVDRKRPHRWAAVHESAFIPREEAAARSKVPAMLAYAKKKVEEAIQPTLWNTLAERVPAEKLGDYKRVFEEIRAQALAWQQRLKKLESGDEAVVDEIVNSFSTEDVVAFYDWVVENVRWRDLVPFEAYPWWRDMMWRHRRFTSIAVTILFSLVFVPTFAVASFLIFEEATPGVVVASVLALASGPLLAMTR